MDLILKSCTSWCKFPVHSVPWKVESKVYGSLWLQCFDTVDPQQKDKTHHKEQKHFRMLTQEKEQMRVDILNFTSRLWSLNLAHFGWPQLLPSPVCATAQV